MSNTIFITANWTTGALSQQTISRQYDNNRYAVQFIGYPEGDGTEELDLYLLVWMSTAPGQKSGEITPIQLNSDQWYISNYFTQQVQVIKFQLCVLNEAGTYEAHSPIFSGRIGDSLEHNGTSHDIDVSTLFDAYREYVEELIIGAGAVIIDPTPTQGSTNAVSSGGVYDEIDSLKSDLTATDTRISNNMLRYEQDYQEDFEVANEYATKYLVRALGGTSYSITNHASNAITVRQKLLDGTASSLGNVASLDTSTFTFDNECDIGIYSATDINVTIKNVDGVLHKVKVIGDEVDTLETYVGRLNVMSQRGDLVAYITNYGEFWNNDRDVHFGGDLIVRPDESGTAYTFTVAQIISKASSAGLATLSDGYNSGAVSFLYFDLNTKDIGFATSWLSDKTKVVLFGYSYKLTFGLLVDYYTSKNSYLIKPLSDKVDTIIGSGTTEIPSYWKTYIDGKINDVKSLVESSDDSFFFVTDIHVPRNQMHSPNIIRYIQSRIDIPNVICGGDYLTGADSKRGALDQLYAWINDSDRDWMQVRGNHDNNYLGTGEVTSKDFFNVSTRRLRNGVTVKEYPNNIFVYDNENTKFRYIFLDTIKEGTYDVSNQVAWMQAKITELDSTWSVIVFTHMYFAPRGVTTETLTALDVGRQIKEGIDDIYDSANATIVAYICGHCHRDYSLITEKGYPIIATSCDASTGDVVSGWDRNYPTATVGTITEQCMDIFGIDKANRTITAYRIGRGSVSDSASGQGATIQRTFTY